MISKTPSVVDAKLQAGTKKSGKDKIQALVARLLAVQARYQLFISRKLISPNVLEGKEVQDLPKLEAIMSAMEHIDAAASTGLVVRNIDAAEVVGMSRFHFNRVFHDTVGVTFKDFATECQIWHLKERLIKKIRSGERMHLKDFVAGTSFVHQSHMNARFRQFTKMTPGEWVRTFKLIEELNTMPAENIASVVPRQLAEKYRFENTLRLQKCFRLETGVSIKKWLKERQAKGCV